LRSDESQRSELRIYSTQRAFSMPELEPKVWSTSYVFEMVHCGSLVPPTNTIQATTTTASPRKHILMHTLLRLMSSWIITHHVYALTARSHNVFGMIPPMTRFDATAVLCSTLKTCLWPVSNASRLSLNLKEAKGLLRTARSRSSPAWQYVLTAMPPTTVLAHPSIVGPTPRRIQDDVLVLRKEKRER
jgi:hypothetical protein